MTLTSKALRFKSKFITAELASLFSQSDSEEEFEGFSEEEDEESFNKQCKMVYSEDDSELDTGFYSDGEEASPRKRRSLLVALRFPVKRLSTPKQRRQENSVKKTVKGMSHPQKARSGQRKQQQQDREGEEEEEEEEQEDEDEKQVLSQSLKKRNKNIQENKAMLAKLFADLGTVGELTSPSTPQKKKQVAEKSTPRKPKVDVTSERRNPSRKARPPENFAVEEKSEPVTHRIARTVDIVKLMKVDKELVGLERHKLKKRCSSKRSHHVVRSVDNVTKEDLDNIALCNKDKIRDKDNGSSCHQCRQKTLDTKTMCRSGFCAGMRGQFCGPCLKNRYGEDILAVLLDPEWWCPICRGVCNCSLCRRKEGRCATGVLVRLARFHGHHSVHEYLKSIQKELHSSSKK